MPSGAFRGVVGPQRVSVPPAISSSGRCLPPGVPLHAHMARSQGKGSSLDAGLLGPGLSHLCQPPGPSLLFEEEGPQHLLGRGHASLVPGDHSGRLLGGLGLSFLSVFIHVFTRHVVTDHCCVCARRTEPRVPGVGTGAPVGTSPLPARPQGSLAPARACGLGFLTQGCWWEGPNEVSRPLCIPTASLMKDTGGGAPLPGTSQEPSSPTIREGTGESGTWHAPLGKAICPLTCGLLLKEGEDQEGHQGENVLPEPEASSQVGFQHGGEVPMGQRRAGRDTRPPPRQPPALPTPLLNAAVPSRNDFSSLTCFKKFSTGKPQADDVIDSTVQRE